MDDVEQLLEKELGNNQPLILDSSIFDMKEVDDVIRDDVKQNRIQFLFPNKFNQLDLLEECKAITNIGDFDLLYDVTMQMLEGKSVVILMLHDDGTRSELCSFQVTDRYMNLRGIQVIDRYPCLVVWLTELIGEMLLKKSPVPLPSAPSIKAQKKEKTVKKPEGS